MQVGKGSWGLQIGAQSIDLVLLVMNKSGMEKMLRNKVTLGAEASVAGGPVGRDARAATDAQMKAEILSYSRTQGLFAGVNLSGGVVKPDEDDNQICTARRRAARCGDGRHGASACGHRAVHGAVEAQIATGGWGSHRPSPLLSTARRSPAAFPRSSRRAAASRANH